MMAQKLEGLGIDEEEARRGRMKKAGRCSPELGRQAQTEQKEVADGDAGLNDLNLIPTLSILIGSLYSQRIDRNRRLYLPTDREFRKKRKIRKELLTIQEVIRVILILSNFISNNFIHIADSTSNIPPSALLKKRYALRPLNIHTFIVNFRISSKRRSPSPIDHTAVSEKMAKSAAVAASDECETLF